MTTDDEKGASIGTKIIAAVIGVGLGAVLLYYVYWQFPHFILSEVTKGATPEDQQFIALCTFSTILGSALLAGWLQSFKFFQVPPLSIYSGTAMGVGLVGLHISDVYSYGWKILGESWPGIFNQNLLDSSLLYVYLVGFIVIYLIPAAVAYLRKHNSWMAILFMSMFLGWTVLGWIGALIWAGTGNVSKDNS